MCRFSIPTRSEAKLLSTHVSSGFMPHASRHLPPRVVNINCTTIVPVTCKTCQQPIPLRCATPHTVAHEGRSNLWQQKCSRIHVRFRISFAVMHIAWFSAMPLLDALFAGGTVSHGIRSDMTTALGCSRHWVSCQSLSATKNTSQLLRLLRYPSTHA